jgi:hypothetical protein
VLSDVVFEILVDCWSADIRKLAMKFNVRWREYFDLMKISPRMRLESIDKLANKELRNI